MKKRILSLLLCCVMLLGLLPTAVFAADAIDYGFTINGTAVTSENIGSLPGVTGTVSYDQATKTLTLDGVTITSSNRKAIECRDGVAAIKLVGANEILFTAEAAVAAKKTQICGIYQGNRDKVLTVFGSSRSDSLKITIPKITNHTLDREYPANCIYAAENLEIKSCTLDILNPEILFLGSDSPLLYSKNGNITIKDCDLKAVLGKDRSGEINAVSRGCIVSARQGDITITDSKVKAGVFSTNVGFFAAIDGANITVTGSELDVKVDVATNGAPDYAYDGYSVRALHIENRSGKINLTNCIGTIEVGSSNHCKCFGIDIWPGAESECLTIDACTLTINILGTNMTLGKEQAILIQDDSDTATNKWPIFKNISAFTYGDTADSTVTKALGSTETGFWRKHYLKIKAAPTALTLDQTALELVSGNSRTLTATVTPAHAEQNVTWTSSNESVATVENGVVTAVRAGIATITASASGQSASCTVTVKEPTYTVTLHTGDGTIADGKNVTEYTYGTGIALPTADDVTYTGHTFKGWYDNESLTGSPVTAIGDTETGNKEYWAKWEINQYTITFDTAGGSEIAPITQDYGTPITAPAAPIRTGYTFAGWSPALPATMPAENMTVTAQWTVNQYTITFDTAGGSTIAPITQDYGTPITAPADPTREGYTFAGWDKAIPATMPAENLTITAQWTVNQYTITFDTAGGSAIAPITQDYGTAITAPADPTREGYTFAGWDKAIPATMPAENLTITAQWRVNRYTITYDLDGGTADDNPTGYTVETETFTLKNPTRPGYIFSGWSGTGLTGEDNLTVTIPKGQHRQPQLYGALALQRRLQTTPSRRLPELALHLSLRQCQRPRGQRSDLHHHPGQGLCRLQRQD